MDKIITQTLCRNDVIFTFLSNSVLAGCTVVVYVCVILWRQGIKTLYILLALCERIPLVLVASYHKGPVHYSDVIMGAIASQITSLTIVYSTIYSGADQRKHQSSASLAFVRGIHRWPVNSPHKWPVTRKMFPFDDVILHASDPVMWSCDPFLL